MSVGPVKLMFFRAYAANLRRKKEPSEACSDAIFKSSVILVVIAAALVFHAVTLLEWLFPAFPAGFARTEVFAFLTAGLGLGIYLLMSHRFSHYEKSPEIVRIYDRPRDRYAWLIEVFVAIVLLISVAWVASFVE